MLVGVNIHVDEEDRQQDTDDTDAPVEQLCCFPRPFQVSFRP